MEIISYLPFQVSPCDCVVPISTALWSFPTLVAGAFHFLSALQVLEYLLAGENLFHPCGRDPVGKKFNVRSNLSEISK